MAILARATAAEDREEGATAAPSLDAIRAAVAAIAGPHPGGGTLELRALGVTRHGTSSRHAEVTRYANDAAGRKSLARDAHAISRRAEGVYLNLNPLAAGLDRNAADADVTRRVWLPVDIDPARPAGTSSTEDELQTAVMLAGSIAQHLADLGWPPPLRADSGNGAHLLYRVDLPPDDGGLVARCLAALSARFSGEFARVDTSVGNPSRIWKLYGTLARKGEPTAERPHRRAELLTYAAGGPKAVPAELLEKLAAEVPAPSPKTVAVSLAPRKRKGIIARARDVDPDDDLDRARAYLEECEPAVSGEKGHDTTFRVVAAVGPGFDLDPEDCLRTLLTYYNPKCQPPWTEKELRHKVETAYAKEDRRGWLKEARRGAEAPAKAGPGRPRKTPAAAPIESPDSGVLEAFDDPHRLGRLYLGERHEHPEGPLLRYWDEQWWAWDGRAWRVRKDREVLAELTASAKAELDRVAKQAGVPSKGVGTRLVGNVAQAIRGETLLRLPDVPEQPAWIAREAGDHGPLEYLSAANGLVHLPTLVAGGAGAEGVLRGPTPRYFSPASLDYPFLPDAPDPDRWANFLEDLWPEDQDAINCLQEWFGYLLTLDTRMQKILLLVGPKRSGKGTITRTLVQLIGHANHAAPTLASLADRFGLASLIGKQLAIVPEARISGRADGQAIVERLLSISGEDPQSIDRKHLTAWHGRLLCRFVLLGNELPRLGDHSGALASRLVVLRLERSFLGREDLDLGARLEPELPGILLWAIDGLKRLRANRRFTVPASSAELMAEFERLSNPVGAFLEEKCDLGPEFRVLCGDLYQAWLSWCKDQGRDHPGDQQSFGRSLHAAIPKLRMSRPRGDDGDRARCYVGVGMRSANGEVF